MANSGHPVIDHLLREQEALLAKKPEWKADPKRAQADMAELRAGLIKHYGVPPELVETFPHHAGVLIGLDALKSHGLRAENEKLKAQLAEHKKASARTAENRRMKDLKKELADARENPGGKMAPLDIIAKHLGEDTEA